MSSRRPSASRQCARPFHLAGEIGEGESQLLTIEARAPGRTQPLLPCWQMSLPSWIDSRCGPPTLRALISRIVAADLDARREQLDTRHVLHILTKLEVWDHPADAAVAIDQVHEGCTTVEAIAKALWAFEAGRYSVVIDGHKERDLDAKLFLGPDTHITFVCHPVVARA